jgi:Xaa-Pro dipeptidase
MTRRVLSIIEGLSMQTGMIQISSLTTARKATFFISQVKSQTPTTAKTLKSFPPFFFFFLLSYLALGVEDPGYHVIVDINTTMVYLFTPSIDSTECLWKCPPAAPNKLLRLYDVDSVQDEQDLDQLLYELNPSTIYTLSTTDTAMIPSVFQPRMNMHGCLRQVLDECRLIKSPWEIKLLRQVTQASSQAHVALMRDAHPHQPESELVALFHWICSRHGLTRQAYVSCVCVSYRRMLNIYFSDPYCCLWKTHGGVA